MKIKTWIEKIENTEISLWGIVFVLYVVMFFRAFLENYTNSNNLYHMSGIVDIFFHLEKQFFGNR